MLEPLVSNNRDSLLYIFQQPELRLAQKLQNKPELKTSEMFDLEHFTELIKKQKKIGILGSRGLSTSHVSIR